MERFNQLRSKNVKFYLFMIIYHMLHEYGEITQKNLLISYKLKSQKVAPEYNPCGTSNKLYSLLPLNRTH